MESGPRTLQEEYINVNVISPLIQENMNKFLIRLISSKLLELYIFQMNK